MKLSKRQLQPPFRQQDLLPVRDFVRYCSDRGITTDEHQLEYYERLWLLLPAVRVNPGYVERRRVLVRTRKGLQWQFWPEQQLPRLRYKRVDSRTFYKYAPVLTSVDNWLCEYEKMGMVLYPSKCRFRKWRYYRGRKVGRREYWATVPPPKYVALYSTYQIFPLWLIQQGLRLSISGKLLFADDDNWIRFGRETREFFSTAPRQLRKLALRYYRIIDLITAVADLREEMLGTAQKAREGYLAEPRRSIDEQEGKKEAFLELRGSIRHQEKEVIAPEARKVLRKSGLLINEVKKARLGLVDLAVGAESPHVLLICLEHIAERNVTRLRGRVRFALECCGIADLLGWFLEVLGQKVPSLEQTLTGTERFRPCCVCGRLFEQRRRTWVTCGNERCKREHRNRQKRDKRRNGLME